MFPAKTTRPEPAATTPPRTPNTPTDGSNPFLHGYPSGSKPDTMTTSTASPDTATSESRSRLPGDTSLRPQSKIAGSREGADTKATPPSSATAQLYNRFAQGQQRTPRRPIPTLGQDKPRGQGTPRQVISDIRRTANRQANPQQNVALRQLVDLEKQASRTWRAGDVYSPKDLSPFEQTKARIARQPNSRFRMQTRARSRRQGGADTFDILRLNPLNEYKNYTMMGEFVSEMGRINGATRTGLRAVNQRKLAKAVRRSIGMGLVPSVHRHPELLPERIDQRTYLWSRLSGAQ